MPSPDSPLAAASHAQLESPQRAQRTQQLLLQLLLQRAQLLQYVLQSLEAAPVQKHTCTLSNQIDSGGSINSNANSNSNSDSDSDSDSRSDMP